MQYVHVEVNGTDFDRQQLLSNLTPHPTTTTAPKPEPPTPKHSNSLTLHESIDRPLQGYLPPRLPWHFGESSINKCPPRSRRWRPPPTAAAAAAAAATIRPAGSGCRGAAVRAAAARTAAVPAHSHCAGTAWPLSWQPPQPPPLQGAQQQPRPLPRPAIARRSASPLRSSCWLVRLQGGLGHGASTEGQPLCRPVELTGGSWLVAGCCGR